MSTVSVPLVRPVLVDRIVTRRLVTDLALVLGGVALTAGAAQLAVPLWPVPITGQTLAVLLVGMSLGALRGAISMGLYALLGGLGLPIFSNHLAGWSIIAGPTGGFIIGFVASAALTGWLAQLAWDRKVARAFLAFVVGSLVTFAFGLPWLAVWLGNMGYPNDINAVLQAGFYPFILGGIIKAILGAGIITAAWAIVDRSDRQTAKLADTK
jgi:biotin transport system substrate-specific component